MAIETGTIGKQVFRKSRLSYQKNISRNLFFKLLACKFVGYRYFAQFVWQNYILFLSKTFFGAKSQVICLVQSLYFTHSLWGKTYSSFVPHRVYVGSFASYEAHRIERQFSSYMHILWGKAILHLFPPQFTCQSRNLFVSCPVYGRKLQFICFMHSLLECKIYCLFHVQLVGYRPVVFLFYAQFMQQIYNSFVSPRFIKLIWIAFK